MSNMEVGNLLSSVVWNKFHGSSLGPSSPGSGLSVESSDGDFDEDTKAHREAVQQQGSPTKKPKYHNAEDDRCPVYVVNSMELPSKWYEEILDDHGK